ncbi:hypothetical protein EDC23_1992 [Thiohalophilus thiocyanatoxydans]|uniref:Uncharacterized protein n=1 Tax=Thiohalophilus thiocyanatoxydans TaxID=381308 RepID=A0A4R8IIL1_9GAMM|nr:hypothetical protein EDC23_1992 [Thiohalophilus thiocyanatoxydans]
MKAAAEDAKCLPGLAEPCDINTPSESFERIGGLLSKQGALCRLISSRRKIHRYPAANHPDYLKHILEPGGETGLPEADLSAYQIAQQLRGGPGVFLAEGQIKVGAVDLSASQRQGK